LSQKRFSSMHAQLPAGIYSMQAVFLFNMFWS